MEVWRAVVGWEGLYEVSDRGRVRSVNRVTAGRHGPTRYQGRLLTATPTRKGYLHVCLTSSKRKKHAYVHDLVLAAFVGSKPAELEACHGDGKPANNNRGNLRYGTRRDNALDRHKHGTMLKWKGEEVPGSKLSEDAVRWLRNCVGVVSFREMAKVLGVSHKTVSDAAHYRSWAHVK